MRVRCEQVKRGHSPERLGGAGSLSHGGQGDEGGDVMHDGGADW